MSVWTSSTTGPILDGLRVVDMTTGLAGPVATLFLAEAGADVVKVETADGDPTRRTAAFATWNRSKQSVVLDVADAADRARLDELLAGADVFVHGLRPRVATRHGLDDAALAEQFPHLIVAAVLGYATQSGDADRPGHDILVQARSGAMDETRGNRPGPIHLRLPLPSWSAAYLATAGILARLIARERTGSAGVAHTSLHQGMLALLAMLWNRAERPTDLLLSKEPMAKDLPTSVYMLYECADGEWIQINGGYFEMPLFVETQAELGLVEPPPTEAPAAVYAHRSKVFRARPSGEWLDAMHDYDCPVALVRGLGELLNDEDVRQNRYAVDVDDPVWGRARQAGWPFAVEPPMAVRSPAPRLGEHGQIDWDRRDAPPASSPSLRYPLEGLKVLDLGVQLAGPFGVMLMADLGAEVIKVDPPAGDPMRNTEMLFLGCQRGKRSIALDLKQPAARPVLERLVRWADVVHHNIRMPAARALGLDDAGLRAVNPDVVFCHVSAYGTLGPRADWPGYAPVAQAISGWHREVAGEGQRPQFYRFAQFDHMCGLSSLVATLLAVLHRDRTGHATSVSASLVGGAAMSTSETMFLLDEERFAPVPRLDANQTGVAPGYRIYPVAGDQWVAVAAVGSAQLDALLRVAGARGPDDIEAALLGREATELLAALDDAGVPAELVRVGQEIPFFDDPANVAARLAVRYPQERYGLLEQPGAFWDFGDLDVHLELAPPGLGEHAGVVLRELGFSDDEVGDLAASGAVGSLAGTSRAVPTH